MTETFNPCEDIADNIGHLFSCSIVGDFTRIRTPYVYPDGDVIDLFFKEKVGIKTLTDLGETVRWLRMQAVSKDRSHKQERLIQDICLTHGVQFHRGMLIIHLSNPNESRSLSQALVDLSEAAIRVSDLWFTQTNRDNASIIDDIEEYLKSSGISYQRDLKIEGVSGYLWKPHFYTSTDIVSAYTFVLSSSSKNAAPGIAYRVVSAWYDLRNLKAGKGQNIKFISLFNDLSDIWTDEDYKLLQELSEITYWSNKNKYLRVLTR
jgi:hypothetical protein